MTVKNNTTRQKLEKVAKRQQHFGIRKLTIGAASVLLGTTLWMGFNANNAEASEADKANNNDNDETQKAVKSPAGDQTSGASTEAAKNIVVNPENNIKAPAENKATDNGDVAKVTGQKADHTVTSGMTDETSENKSATHAKSNGDDHNHPVKTEQSDNNAATGSKSSENKKGTEVNTNLGADGNTVGKSGKTESIPGKVRNQEFNITKSGLKGNTDGLGKPSINTLLTNLAVDPTKGSNEVDTDKSKKAFAALLGTSLVKESTDGEDTDNPKISILDPENNLEGGKYYKAQQIVNSAQPTKKLIAYQISQMGKMGFNGTTNGGVLGNFNLILSYSKNDGSIWYTITDNNLANPQQTVELGSSPTLITHDNLSFYLKKYNLNSNVIPGATNTTETTSVNIYSKDHKTDNAILANGNTDYDDVSASFTQTAPMKVTNTITYKDIDDNSEIGPKQVTVNGYSGQQYKLSDAAVNISQYKYYGYQIGDGKIITNTIDDSVKQTITPSKPFTYLSALDMNGVVVNLLHQLNADDSESVTSYKNGIKIGGPSIIHSNESEGHFKNEVGKFITTKAFPKGTPNITIYYKKDVQKQNATLNYVDETTGQEIESLKDGTRISPSTKTGASTEDISFDNGSSQVDSIVKNGYVFDKVLDGTTNLNVNSYPTSFGKFGNTDKTFTIYFKHGVDTETQNKTVNETINYVTEDTPQETLDTKNNGSVTFTRTAYKDKVTGNYVKASDVGQISDQNVVRDANVTESTTPTYNWTSTKDHFDSVESPETLVSETYQVDSVQTGYADSTNPHNVKSVTVDPSQYKDGDTIKINVYYTPKKVEKQTATLTIIDRNTGKQINVPRITTYFTESGNAGDTIQFPDNNAESEVRQLESLGYTYSPDYSKDDEYSPTHEVYDNDSKTSQDYVIRMSNPQQYTNDGTLTIRFVDSTTGKEIHKSDKSLSVTFTKTGNNPWSGTNYKNGKVVNSDDQAFGSFNPQDNFYTYGYIDMPVIKGYVYVKNDRANDYNHDEVIVKQDANGKWITGGLVAPFNQLSQTLTLLYCPLAKIHQVDTNGRDITTPTPYNGDKTDPTKAGVTDVPNVPDGYEIVPMDQQPNYGYNPVNMGYDPTTNKVTPKFPTTDTVIVYQKVQQAKLKIVDQDNNYQQIEKDDVKTDFTDNGQPGGQISFDSSKSVQDLENDGYVYVSTDLPSNASFDDYDDSNGATQNYVIVMKHGTEPVGPNNPEDKDGLRKSDLSTTVKRTINYVDTDNNKVNGAPDGNSTYTQEADFTRTAIVDKVTGDILGYDVDGDGKVDINPANKDSAWVSKNNTFSEVDSKDPIKLGYDNVDTKSVDEVTVAWNSPSKTITVVYSKKPEVPTKQAEKANLKIYDINQKDTNGDPQQIGDTFNATGDDNTQITFTGAQTTIDSLIKAGYKVYSIVQATSDPHKPIQYVTDYASASKDWKFDTLPHQDQSFVVYLEHTYDDVTPNQSYGVKNLTKTVNETVHYYYENADGSISNKQAATNATNHVTFSASGKIDKVTGKLLALQKDSSGHLVKDEKGNYLFDTDSSKEINISDLTSDNETNYFLWNDPATFVKMPSPKINGYHVDQKKTNPHDYADGDDIKEFTDINHNSKDIVANVYYAADPVYTHSAGLKIYTGIDGQDESEFTQNGSASINNAQPGSDIKFGYKDNLDSLIKSGYTVKDVKDVTDPKNPKSLTVPQDYDYDKIESQFGEISSDSKNTDQEFAIYLTKPAPKSQQNAELVIHDDTDNQDLSELTTSGLQDGQIKFKNGADQVQYYINRGYKWENANANDTRLDATNYAGIKFGTFDNTDDSNGTSQKWVINLVHATAPVDPTHTPTPGDKVPNDPDNHTYPNNTVPTNLTKDVTRTVSYQYEDGTQALPSVPQKVTFTGKGTIDLVTGNLVDPDNIKAQNGKITWTATPNNAQYSEVPAIDTTQYSIIKVSEDGTTANVDTTTGKVASETVTAQSPNSTIVITLAKKQQQASLVFHDDTSNVDLTSSIPAQGTTDDAIKFTNADKILSGYIDGENAKYKFVSTTEDGQTTPLTTNETDALAKFGNYDAKAKSFVVHLIHNVTKVDHNNPHGLDLDKTITRDVKYQYENGDQAAEPATQSTEFYGEGYIDNVTGQLVDYENGQIQKNVDGSIKAGQITWMVKGGTTDSDSFTDIKAPTVPNASITKIETKGDTDGYQVTDQGEVTAQQLTHNSADSHVIITYKKGKTPQNAQTITVDYKDDTTNQIIPGHHWSLSVEAGKSLNGYSTATDIQNIEKLGYKFVSDEFSDAHLNDKMPEKGGNYIVHFVHGYKPVNPGNPDKPDDPSNNYQGVNLVQNVTRDIQYVISDGGATAPAEKKETKTFVANGYVDTVTGKLVQVKANDNSKTDDKGNIVYGDIVKDANGDIVQGSLTWTVKGGNKDSASFEEVYNPTVDGYKVTSITPSSEETGSDLKGVKSYKVNHSSADKTIVVVYTKKPTTPVVQQAEVIYQDVNDPKNPVTITTKTDLTGQAGDPINYKTADEIGTLEKEGYVLVSNGFDPDGTAPVYDNASGTQTFYVKLKHGTVPVNPQNPGKPGDKLNPKDPRNDPPTYPDGTDKLSVTAGRTIHYIKEDNNGNRTEFMDPIDQTATFTASGVLDKVTGKWVNPDGKDGLEWSGNSDLSGRKSPVIDGWHLVSISRDSKDQKNVDATTVNAQTGTYEVDVIYKPNGKVIPIDKTTGKQIPGTDTPTFPTDPTDPTKVDTTKIPGVPSGFTPENPTQTPGSNINPDPNNPGSDVKVPFVPAKPIVNDQTIQIKYVDDSTVGKQDLSGYDKSFTGKPGDSIGNGYTTQDSITDLENKGFKLVKDEFKDANLGNKIPEQGGTYVVHFIHDTVPVTPDKPKNPTDLINDPKKDPDGPKYPSGLTKTDLNKTVTRTINYVDSDGKPVNGSPDGKSTYTQIAHFSRTAIVDRVTGDLLGYDTDNDDQVDVKNGDYAWKSTDNTFDEVDSKDPSTVGYDHVDISKIGKQTVAHNSDNQTFTVTYTKNPTIPENQNASLTIIDETNGKHLGDYTDNGQPNTLINFGKASDNIQNFLNNGYVWDATKTTGKAANYAGLGIDKFDNDSQTLQAWTVYLKHGVEKVDKNNPHGIDPKNLERTVTTTINYVDDQGHKLTDQPIVNSQTFEALGYVDKVTGEWVTADDQKANGLTWTA